MLARQLKKSTVAVICAGLLMQSVLTAANPQKEIYKENPWRFMEYTFVTQPEATCNSILSKLGVAGSTVGGFVPGTWYGISKAMKFKDSIEYSDKLFDTRNILKGVAALTAIIALPIVGYKLAKYIIERSVFYNTLQKFVEEWDENKQYTPQELHASFNALHEKFVDKTILQGGALGLGKNLIHDESFENIKQIQHVIHREFQSKYGHRLLVSDAPKSQFSRFDTPFVKYLLIGLGIAGGATATILGTLKSIELLKRVY